ncbi:hypothetical protein [Actibacterium sp. 188UL27-1]|uniref:hypothetical protein n=1 Tax=Actibacterium sp. 188UL27-1 TaxID=2786961 RepID=UPI001EF4C00A|nr:hypothetical protein [Actibacterium sp. 188UL27-1]
MRAGLVALLIATPSLLLPKVSPDTTQVVALIALFAAALIFIEYVSSYPSLIEFRDAPPFNRVRFLCLFFTVFLLSVIMRGQEAPSGLTMLTHAVGTLIGNAIDFPYSPVRLVVLGMADVSDPHSVDVIRTAAGISYLTSLLSLAIFALLLRLFGWPSRTGAFNVWINLPTFDPTTGGDVVSRLNRDARVNIALGFLLPFLIPAVAQAAGSLFGPSLADAPQTLVWTMAAWAFLPASLFMRGIAMGRIATMIEDKRKRSSLDGTDGGLLVT